MLFEKSLGVYFSDRNMTMVCLKNSLKEIRLSEHATFIFDKEKDLKDKINDCSTLIRDFLFENRLSSIEIFLALPSDAAVLKEIEYPSVAKENLRSTIQYDLDKHIPLPPNDIYMDFQLLPGEKSEGRLHVLLAIAKKNSIAEYMEIPNRIETGISGIEISSSALVNYISYMKLDIDVNQYGYLYDDGCGVEIGFVKNQMIRHVKSISPGKAEFVEAKVKNELARLKILVSDQRQLKVFAAGSDHINNMLQNYKSDLDIQVAAIPTDNLPSPDFIPAFGAAIKGLRKSPAQINFLPDYLRKRPSKKAFYCMLILITLMIILSLTWSVSSLARKRQISNSLDSDLQELSIEVKKIYGMQKEIQYMEKKIDLYNKVRSESAPVLDILKEFSLILPESSWIQDFSLSERGVRIEGYAQSASDLIPIIEESPLFKDVVFLSTITKEKDGGEKFQIGLNLE